MNIFERIRNRSQRGQASPRSSMEPGSPGTDGLPTPGYDRMDAREVGERLPQLSQVELGEVEAYERSHENRPVVLDKLRYMRGLEPLPGYDALSPEQIVEALVGADAETVKAVRDYERKFKRRAEVVAEAARVLPTAQASPEEDRARQDRATRVRDGIAGRAKTAGDVASRRSTSPNGSADG